MRSWETKKNAIFIYERGLHHELVRSAVGRWLVLREMYCWLVGDGWFVLREMYCWRVADKPNEQGGSSIFIYA
jgi:hypothetical protein